MVVRYASAAQGSWLSYFVVTPKLVFHCRGSILTSVWPQILIATGLGVVSIYWNPLRRLPEDAQPDKAFNVLTFLLSFLLVFKTQSAYNQHWTAITTVENLMAVYRELGISACTMFDWEKDPEIKAYTRKVMRLIVLHFCVTLEYFRRTGVDECTNKQQLDYLRKDIQLVTGPSEYKALYPTETHDVTGSKSQYPHTHPMMIVFWIDLVFSRCFKAGGVLSPPHAASLSSLTSQLLVNFRQMDQINRTQFPLPYAQLVKIILSTWVFCLPFVLEFSTYAFTPVAMLIIALALFGLDEVAEVMESPFGMDPNDINLEEYREELVRDLELMFYGREMKMDKVFTDDMELCLRGITEGGTSVERLSTHSFSNAHGSARSISGLIGSSPRVRLEAPAVADMRAAFIEVIEDAEFAALRQESALRRSNCAEPLFPPGFVDGGFEDAGELPAKNPPQAEPVMPEMAKRLSTRSLEVPSPMLKSRKSSKSSLPSIQVTDADCSPRLDPRGGVPLDRDGDGQLGCLVEEKEADFELPADALAIHASPSDHESRTPPEEVHVVTSDGRPEYGFALESDAPPLGGGSRHTLPPMRDGHLYMAAPETRPPGSGDGRHLRHQAAQSDAGRTASGMYEAWRASQTGGRRSV